MFLSNASVKRPVAIGCLVIALVFLGANAYRWLGLELIPRMDIPEASVVTVWPGATPADLEADVAKRIEEAISSVEGLKHTTSILMDNVCQIAVEFTMDTDIDKAVADMRQEIDAIYNDLPAGCEKPVVLKVDVNATPVATLAFAGDLPAPLLYDFVDQELSERFAAIPGVANIVYVR